MLWLFGLAFCVVASTAGTLDVQANGDTGDRRLDGSAPSADRPKELTFPSTATKAGVVRRLTLKRELVEIPEQGPEPRAFRQGLQTSHFALVKSKPQSRLSAQSVAVRCGEGEVNAEVKRDFLGNGQRVKASDLMLGGCAASMTDTSLVYTFSLVYEPTPIGTTSIIKTNAAQAEIECRYPRKQLVSSGGVRPSWKPHATAVLTEQRLGFSLRLMTEDWRHQRPSAVYRVGDVMHVEASVLGGHHVPLVVFVDHCQATLGPDATAQPSYRFISNHGCLTDAKVTGGRSYFKDRSRDEMLRFQLQAFRFPQDPRAAMFITCYLKATAVPAAIDAEHKACSFLTEANRWVASGGDNQVCSCCETTCSVQRRRSKRNGNQSSDTDLEWAGQAALGPILVQEVTPERAGLPDASGVLPPPLVFQDAELPLEDSFPPRLLPSAPDSAPSTLVLCSLGVAGALLQGLVAFSIIVLIYRQSRRQPARHAMCT
ncbi:hypothetical protein NHX12_015221 [Muraenolepis orangiensis]|uniref:Zona pellucida sperm-binding protein 3 n=1 Tax=Muraenolepis orangiensis TaxID=630683 RepID=A0A9Q0I5V6_9TELE|nr:hypothetical protein NHX12_015221 [Muraenolepis orangiensis]